MIGDENERLSMELLRMFPPEISERVFRDAMCEIDPEFMGFVVQYESLSKIIPKHFTVVDLGCYAAAQCGFFADHARYIGVDRYDGPRFSTPNADHVIGSIQEFCANGAMDLRMETTFAICNYVPDRIAKAAARSTFPNVWVFYPGH